MNQTARGLKLSQRLIGDLAEVDLRNLRMFRAVAEAGGISSAAAQRGIEKSVVSRAIQALESRLDGTVCERGPRGFRMTEYGQAVYAAATTVDDAIDRARDEINAAHNRYEGEVRLVVADSCLTNTQAKISDALELFLSHAPDVRLSVSIDPPDRLMAALAERRAHLGIVAFDPGRKGVEQQPLFLEDYRLWCCPPAGEDAPHLESLATYGYGIVRRTFSHAGPSEQSLRVEASWVAHASGIEAVATLINTGRCVGFLPTHYVTGTQTRRPFTEVHGAERLRAVSVFCVASERARPMSQAVRVMREALLRVARRAGTAQAAAAETAGIAPA